MPNRFIFSLRFSTKVFLKIGLISLVLITFMTFFRLNLYFLSVFYATPDAVGVDVFNSFVMGLRFDLLIYGFILAPLYLLSLVPLFLEKWPRIYFRGVRFYLSLTWLAVCVLTYLDFFHFSKYGKRMRFADYQSWNFEVFENYWNALPQYNGLIFSVISLLLLVLGLMVIKNLRFEDWKSLISPQKSRKGEVALRLIVPLLVIFLAARGTVEAHHLELQHSQVSSFDAINEMTLNAVWCFDK